MTTPTPMLDALLTTYKAGLLSGQDLSLRDLKNGNLSILSMTRSHYHTLRGELARVDWQRDADANHQAFLGMDIIIRADALMDEPRIKVFRGNEIVCTIIGADVIYPRKPAFSAS